MEILQKGPWLKKNRIYAWSLIWLFNDLKNFLLFSHNLRHIVGPLNFFLLTYIFRTFPPNMHPISRQMRLKIINAHILKTLQNFSHIFRYYITYLWHFNHQCIVIFIRPCIYTKVTSLLSLVVNKNKAKWPWKCSKPLEFTLSMILACKVNF